jgi:hypothetical protein
MSSRWRKIVVDGKQYRWRGHQFFIAQDSNGYRVFGEHGNVVKGLSVEAWERGCRKRTPDGAVMPSDIAAYIRKKVG